ncbi:methyl-accepting chemotaxis protein [Krasilnikovia sp. MM14-A1259]|uniref:methyl-accepting chemotaxis protein n=1 Tax=Krasilnikovia sp. MM14-A1259 TaxID=3373539 RepID=UPI00399C8352
MRGVLRRWVDNRAMNTKILLVVAILAATSIGVGMVSLARLAEINDRAHTLYEGSVLPVEHVEALAQTMTQTRLDVLNQAVSTTSANVTRYEQIIKNDDAAFASRLAVYRPQSAAPELVDQLVTTWREYQQDRQGMLDAGRRNDFKTVETVRDTVVRPLVDKASAIVSDLVTREETDAASVAAGAESAYRTARTATIAFLLGGLVLSVAFGLFVSRRIVGVLHRVSTVIDGMAAGDLTRSAGVTSRDELGRMAAGLDTATSRVRETIGALSASSQTLSDAAQQLSNVSQQIGDSAGQTSAGAGSASAAAEQISRNVETVATGAEEMGASIREIATSATYAAQIAEGAVLTAEDANQTVHKLGRSSAEIGTVVKLITSIAEQTNLLALNATIEAARAGEAGKGFAVVATEVKDLAQATADATGDISARIQQIQDDSDAAVASIGHISEVIDKINGYSATIASAVEEQTATTTEISRNVAEAATGSADIARNITEVATAAQSTHSGVTEAQRSADRLTQLSGELQHLVGTFQI